MNVLLYVLDALRADHLSCYGYERDTSERIDQLASEGIRYDRCYSPSTWTKPVGASLLTGLYPPAHGVRTREDVFVAAVPRLPELLQREGFTTAGFSSMGNVSATLGFDEGFDIFRDLYKEPSIVEQRTTKQADTEELENESTDHIALPRASDLTNTVLDWLEGVGDDFFAFCWSVEPHIPYDPPAGFGRYVEETYNGPVDGTRETLAKVDTESDLQHLIDLYDSEIRYNDRELGRLVDGLKQMDIYDDTLIVLLGDHGDAFQEHGRLTHGHLPYEELVHVPLVMKPPAGGIESTIVKEITSLVDVVPTILQAVDGERGTTEVQGRPLPPFGPTGTSTPIYSETRSRDIYPAFYSVRTERWKYMEVDSPNRSLGTLLEIVKSLYSRNIISEILKNPLHYLDRYIHDQDRFLYDIESDIAETRNLVEERPEKVARHERLLAEWLDSGREYRGQDRTDQESHIDAQTSEQLRKLGYVD
jgi:arylsulfatase